MSRFVVRRVVQSVFLLLGITIITFAVSHLAPGGPETLIEDPNIPAEYLARLRADYGLDDPLPVQYGKWVGNLVRGNFGRSFEDNRPVLDKIAERLPATLELSLSGFALGLLGIPLGIQAALHRGSFVDGAIRVFTVIGQALPHWWLGLMVIIVTAPLGIIPLGGIADPDRPNDVLDRLRHLLLPAVITAMTGWIVFSRFVRSELLEVLGQEYVRTARGKGVSEHGVLSRHALRNALLPVITVLGSSLAPLISGAVLFETVFSWPGMGRLAVTAAFRRDYPTVMALTVVVAALVIVGNLLADLAYGYADPRVRYD